MKPIPTVLQVVPALITGGVERGTVDLACFLKRKGGNPIVAASTENSALIQELKKHEIQYLRLPLATKNPFGIWRNISALEKIIKEHDVDVIHARSRAPAWSAYFAAKRQKKPFVTTFHGVYSASSKLKRFYNSIMAMGDVVIANSTFTADHIEQGYPEARGRTQVVHRGIDSDYFSPHHVNPTRLIQWAQKWGLPEDKLIITLPGRLTRWKGQTILIEAIAELKRLDICCLLVGSDQGRTKYRQELEDLITSKELGEFVKIVDHCNDMPAAYMLSDVVVSASTNPEAFGRIIAEAQAMGRVVVASNHGGAKEIILEGKTGWLVESGNSHAFKEALIKALSLTPEERARFSARAIKHVLAHFTKDHMCSKTLKVYKSLLNNSQEEDEKPST